MVKDIKHVVLAVLMMVFLNIAHAQQSFEDRFIVLELDVAKNGYQAGINSQGKKEWSIDSGTGYWYKFTVQRQVPKWAMSRSNFVLDVPTFRSSIAKGSFLENSGRDAPQFKQLYIKEVTPLAANYYQVQFQVEPIVIFMCP